MNRILTKYRGYDIKVTAHSNGALNLIDALSDGDVDDSAADYFVVNSPAVRDAHWMKKVNSYITRDKPDNVKMISSQFDFGEGTSIGNVKNPFPQGFHPDFYFQPYKTITIQHPESPFDTYQPGMWTKGKRGLEQHMWSHFKPPWIALDRLIHGNIEKLFPQATQPGKPFNPIDEILES